jgi:hypothetical protein
MTAVCAVVNRFSFLPFSVSSMLSVANAFSPSTVPAG